LFAPLEALALPGHDVDVLKGLLEQFTTDMKPDNLLDRMHVRDLAFGTAMAEFLRAVVPGVMADTIEEIAREGGSPAAPLADQPRKPVPRDQRLTAKAFRKHIGLFAQLIEMQEMVLIERDRTASILKETRLNDLRDQLKGLERMMEASGYTAKDIDDD
jgi:hypothetical protein